VNDLPVTVTNDQTRALCHWW